MLISLSYSIIGGLILYLIEKMVMRKKETDLYSFHKITGIINLCLAIFFLILYLLFPDMFSENVKINNQFIYICFSILASYYYILAAPLSMANSLAILKIKSKNKIQLFINVLAFIILIISFPIFLQ